MMERVFITEFARKNENTITNNPWSLVQGSPAPVPVIIFGGFCNWLELSGVLGFLQWKHVNYDTNYSML